LHLAIQAVAEGGAFLYPGLAKALIRQVIEPGIAASPVPLEKRDAKHLQALTPRELEVLKLVAEGYTNQQIASQLVISVKTVQAHRANVMEKLGLRDITHLVRFALHFGLLPEHWQD
jgi:DNA-binding NarL/FixJ family response regulator